MMLLSITQFKTYNHLIGKIISPSVTRFEPTLEIVYCNTPVKDRMKGLFTKLGNDKQLRYLPHTLCCLT